MDTGPKRRGLQVRGPFTHEILVRESATRGEGEVVVEAKVSGHRRAVRDLAQHVEVRAESIPHKYIKVSRIDLLLQAASCGSPDHTWTHLG